MLARPALSIDIIDSAIPVNPNPPLFVGLFGGSSSVFNWGVLDFLFLFLYSYTKSTGRESHHIQTSAATMKTSSTRDISPLIQQHSSVAGLEFRARLAHHCVNQKLFIAVCVLFIFSPRFHTASATIECRNPILCNTDNLANRQAHLHLQHIYEHHKTP